VLLKRLAGMQRKSNRFGIWGGAGDHGKIGEVQMADLRVPITVRWADPTTKAKYYLEDGVQALWCIFVSSLGD